MPWIYSQSTGDLTHNEEFVVRGYSGRGAGKNNHSMQGVPNVGPIPVGEYVVGPPRLSSKVGPFAMPLTPVSGVQTLGRSAFMIHADSSSNPGSASQGCIILNRPTREKVWLSGDHRLRVVP